MISGSRKQLSARFHNKVSTSIFMLWAATIAWDAEEMRKMYLDFAVRWRKRRPSTINGNCLGRPSWALLPSIGYSPTNLSVWALKPCGLKTIRRCDLLVMRSWSRKNKIAITLLPEVQSQLSLPTKLLLMRHSMSLYQSRSEVAFLLLIPDCANRIGNLTQKLLATIETQSERWHLSQPRWNAEW